MMLFFAVVGVVVCIGGACGLCGLLLVLLEERLRRRR